MKPRYRVTLTEEERRELEALTKTGKTNAKRFLYARSLLLCDAGPQGPAWMVADTAEAMGVTQFSPFSKLHPPNHQGEPRNYLLNGGDVFSLQRVPGHRALRWSGCM